jgi:hypothetical protein
MKNFLFAFLLLTGSAAAQSSGSMYLPVLVDTQSVGRVIFDSLHVVQVDNQVTVWGTVFIANNYPPHRARITFTLPVLTDPTLTDYLTGQMSVHESGFHDPAGGIIRQNAAGVQLEWWPRIGTASNTDFYFTYTVKP